MTSPQRPLLLSAMLAVISLSVTAGETRAQWYPGALWGYAPTYTPPSVEFLNREAIARIEAGPQGPGSFPGIQPDSYSRGTRDPEFFERYDIETRRALEDRVARKPSRSRATARASRPPAPTPASPPIATFFDKYRRLIWPADAPVTGDLGARRAATDKACVTVLEETQQRGAAQLGTVTEARARLLEYGRPALEYVRTHSTPRIAEGFHEFLLSLYDSLAAAVQMPKPPGR